jgi:hypothetical protein
MKLIDRLDRWVSSRTDADMERYEAIFQSAMKIMVTVTFVSVILMVLVGASMGLLHS